MNERLRLWPDDDLFEDDEFLDSAYLRLVAESLLDEFPDDFVDLRSDAAPMIDYKWKRLGGVHNGNAVLGKCVKLSGLAKHYSRGTDFVIWLAADNAEDFQLDETQVRAVMYHELNHVEVLEEGVYRVRGHDLEIFVNEVRRFGAWKPELGALFDAIHQLELRGARPD